MTITTPAVPVTLSLASSFYIFTGSSCISHQNQEISYILSLKAPNIQSPFWILKLKLEFHFFFLQYASKTTNSDLGKKKRKQTPREAPVLHKVFNKIPSSAEVLGKHFLHGHVVNNCCPVFGDDRLLVTLGNRGTRWDQKPPRIPCPLPDFLLLLKGIHDVIKFLIVAERAGAGRAGIWS